ncbi:MAG: hypothetical protein JWN14_3947 [Chthonomonadales bacterium]|nr:hypothetical protein [Chthonomonadales bacterium]
MSLIQPVAISEKPNRKRISYVDVQVSPSEKPTSKAFSFVDIQALGLILLILMVVSMPVYTSVLQNAGKQTSRPALAAHPLKTATANMVAAAGVSSLTKASDASHRSMAR